MWRWLVILALSVWPVAVQAHGGHDHSAPQPVMKTHYSQVEASTTDYEMVLRYEPGEAGQTVSVELFLSRFADNAPVDGAKVELRLDAGTSAKVVLSQAGEGRYIGEIEALAGEHASVTALVTGLSPAAVLVAESLELSVHEDEAAPSKDEPLAPLGFWVGLGVATVVGLALLAWASRRFQAQKASQLAVVLTTGALTFIGLGDSAAWAHGGDDHGAVVQTQAGPGQTVYLPKEAQNLLMLRTTLSETRQITPRLSVTGVVTVPPGRVREVKAPMSGRLEAAQGLMLGKKVKAGELLYTLVALPDASDRASLIAEQNREKAQISALQTRVNQTRKAYERAKALAAKEGMMSQSELDAAESDYALARSALNAAKAGVAALSLQGDSLRIPIVSPIDGEVAALAVSSGEVLGDALLVRVVDRSELLVSAKVLETDAAKVRLQSDAEVRHGEERLKASHVFTGLEVDPQTRAIEVLYRLQADSPNLWVSQFVGVALASGLAVQGVAVPESALMDVDGRPVVWVKRSAETFAPVGVREVAREGGWVAVQGGLKAGERVVIEGAAFLRGARAAGAK